MGISIPGCNLIPVLGTGMSSTQDELIPSPNHVNSIKKMTKHRDSHIPEGKSSRDEKSHVNRPLDHILAR